MQGEVDYESLLHKVNIEADEKCLHKIWIRALPFAFRFPSGTLFLFVSDLIYRVGLDDTVYPPLPI